MGDLTLASFFSFTFTVLVFCPLPSDLFLPLLCITLGMKECIPGRSFLFKWIPPRFSTGRGRRVGEGISTPPTSPPQMVSPGVAAFPPSPFGPSSHQAVVSSVALLLPGSHHCALAPARWLQPLSWSLSCFFILFFFFLIFSMLPSQL